MWKVKDIKETKWNETEHIEMERNELEWKMEKWHIK